MVRIEGARGGQDASAGRGGAVVRAVLAHGEHSSHGIASDEVSGVVHRIADEGGQVAGPITLVLRVGFAEALGDGHDRVGIEGIAHHGHHRSVGELGGRRHGDGQALGVDPSWWAFTEVAGLELAGRQEHGPDGEDGQAGDDGAAATHHEGLVPGAVPVARVVGCARLGLQPSPAGVGLGLGHRPAMA